MAKRIAEFILGLIGGIIGFIAALFALAVGGLGKAFNATGASTISTLGWFGLLFSILGIVGAVVVMSKPKLGGTFMVVSAIGGLISISWFYSLSFILLLIGGLMGILIKDKK